ncbi:MAG TPA: FG-GAP-like repeat-containing protein [Gammaproteobacteria bacterium]|nr:FG-GAP-like repeat-containing protein [Gammaproteobacteria bacterium]
MLALASLALAVVPEARAGFVSTPVTVAHAGVEYVYDVEATGSGNVSITAPYGLPPWLALEQTGNGRARLHGTPAPTDSGQGVVLFAQDDLCQVFLINCYQYQIFDITIVPDAPPVVVAPGIADQTATESGPFQTNVAPAFADPDGDALSFAASGLPASLTMSPSGSITGTPTFADTQGSPYQVVVTASDGRGGSVTDDFTLVIAPLDRADLVLQSISADPAPALAGNAIEWRFAARNDGPQPAGGVELRIELMGDAVQLDAGSCTLSGDPAAGQTAVCELGGLAAGQSGAVMLTGTAAGPGDVFVRATVAAVGGKPIDPGAGNDSASYSLNVGTGVVAEAAQTIAGSAAGAAAADVDGDGFDDAAAAKGADSPLELRLNVENPTLNAALEASDGVRRGLADLPLSLDAPGGPGIAFADVDGDGDLDLWTAGAGALPSTVFVNGGSASFSPGPTIGTAQQDARAIAAADLDGDGLADAVLANAGPDAVYLNRGASGFVAGPALDGAARDSRDVVAVDVDGDARLDLVFANARGSARLYRNSGGAFSAGSVIDTGPATSVASGDFNGDGFPDLVFGRAAAPDGGPPSDPVYLNDGKGAFTAAGALGASPTSDVLVADFDGDGVLDVVAIHATGAHEIFLGDGRGGFAPQGTLFVSADASSAAVARIGRAGYADVLVAGKHGIDVFFNDGRGNLGLGDTSPPVIQLVGDSEVSVEVDAAYQDPGATATDDVDGSVVPSVENPVNTKIIGTYTVKYTAVDSAGNAAEPVTRTVHVNAKRASGGGGGGAVGLGIEALLLAAAAVSAVRRCTPVRERRPRR